METDRDKFLYAGGVGMESFVRLTKVSTAERAGPYPLIYALDTAARLFPVPMERFMPAARKQTHASKTFADRPELPTFGKAIALNGEFLELPLPETAEGPGTPWAEGTVEFWVRPGWSASDTVLATTGLAYICQPMSVPFENL